MSYKDHEPNEAAAMDAPKILVDEHRLLAGVYESAAYFFSQVEGFCELLAEKERKYAHLRRIERTMDNLRAERDRIGEEDALPGKSH